MTVFLLIVHVIVCIVLMGSILLQAGKGGGLAGGAFGGVGGGGAVFGGTGAATFLTKVTTYVAIVFFLTCIGLWHSSRSGDTLPKTAAERMLEEGGPVPLSSPVAPVGEPQPAGSAESPAPATTPSDAGK